MKYIARILTCILLLSCLAGCTSTPAAEAEEETATPIPEAPADLELPMDDAEYPIHDSLANYDTYSNYMTIPDQWDQYGIGDPSITKYNGIYYLYVSTPYTVTGVRCWSSRDLINWTFQGNITEEEAAFTAYSPKVIYWNGSFYLYTTPNGKGLHVLHSDSPTGPFVDVTGYLHNSIDACIFIDDDGSWYMTHGAAMTGVEMHRMPSPTEIDETPIVPGTVVFSEMGNSWTETGQIIKRNDRYFMTFSGNHVCSSAYRTNWAVTDDIGKKFTLGGMPLVCSTDGEQIGTGCGLVFVGPDLLSDYVVYHNLLNPYVGPVRAMAIDRVNYNGNRMIAYGATSFAQTVPELPDLSEYFETGSLLDDNWVVQGNAISENGFVTMNGETLLVSRWQTGPQFAAEYNVIPSTGVKVLFAYTDDGSFACLDLNESGQIILFRVENGQETQLACAEMQADFDPGCLHCISIVSEEDQLKVFVDGMKKLAVDGPTDFSGGIGYFSENEGRAGFIAASNGTWRDAMREAYKPTTGAVFAIDCILTDGSLDETKTAEGTAEGKAIRFSQGDWYRYKLNAPKTGSYTVDVAYRSEETVTVAVTDIKGTILGWGSLPSTNSEWGTYPIRNVVLQGGLQTIAIAVVEGNCELYSFQFSPETPLEEMTIPCILDEENGWQYYDGMWTGTGSVLSLNCLTGYGKVSFGEPGWTDYSMEGTITFSPGSYGSAGFLLRVKNISNGTDYSINNPCNDQCYYAYITAAGEAGICKHNFQDSMPRFKYFDNKSENDSYTLKVEVRGTEIILYVDGTEIVRYTDSEEPYTTGKIGLHGDSTIASFSNITVKPIA